MNPPPQFPNSTRLLCQNYTAHRIILANPFPSFFTLKGFYGNDCLEFQSRSLKPLNRIWAVWELVFLIAGTFSQVNLRSGRGESAASLCLGETPRFTPNNSSIQFQRSCQIAQELSPRRLDSLTRKGAAPSRTGGKDLLPWKNVPFGKSP